MTPDKLNAILANIPYVQTIGAVPMIMGEEVTLKLPFIKSNIGNPILPALHGGCIGGFMEIAAIAQLVYNGEYDKIPKPIDLNIDYLRRGEPLDTFARASIVRQGSRVANVHVRAWQKKLDEPIATLHGHYLTAASTD